MKKTRLFAAIALFLVLASLAIAVVPPPPANQNIGINDSRFDKLGSSAQLPNQAGCRACHTAGVPDRHHNLLAAGKINPVTGSVYACNNCHPVITGPNGQSVYLERECLDCHSGLNFSRVDANATAAKVNISRPHHINPANATSRNCKGCHGSFVANYNDGHYVPLYAPSLVTPEPHYKVYNATSGRYWGGCWACHQNTTANVPALLDQYGTHHGAIMGNRTSNQTTDPRYDHQTDRTSGATCNWCHTTYWNTTTNSERPIGYPNELDFEIRNASSATDPVNGTGCEKCHDVGTIHNIQYNYATTNGQQGYGHIGTNWDCNGCHAFWDAGDSSGFENVFVPQLASVSPGKLTTGVGATLTLSGSDFLSGTGTTNPVGAVVSVDGVEYTPTSVTDTEIVVDVPGQVAGVHNVQVVKKGDYDWQTKTSKLSSIVAVDPVDAVTATKVKLSKTSTKITITGTGFGPQPGEEYTDLGAFVTTTVVNKGKTQTVTYKLVITSWSNTQIVGTVKSANIGDPVTVKAIAGTDTINIS